MAHRSWYGIGVLVALAALAGVALGAAETKPLVLQVPVVKVPVVKSLDELKKQPRITTSDGHVQLGLQADTCPQGTGMLLYCLWTGGDENGYQRGREWRQDERLLGPLKVRVQEIREDKAKPALEALARGMYALAQRKDGGLYVAPVLVGAKARYDVEIVDGDGMPVAAAVVNGTDEKAATWYPLRPKNPAHRVAVRQPPNEEGQKEGAAKPPAEEVLLDTTAFVPRWEGTTPLPATKTLPKFEPDTPEPSLTIAYEAGELTVTSTKSLQLQPEYFLVRWWINGKLAKPAQRELRLTEMWPIRLQPRPPITARWKLPAELGAKPGDKVELQVLYAANRSEPAPGRGSARMFDLRRLAEDGGPVRLSNKVEWVAR